jgi:anti-sigma regulatory factor (Ser/Thr protein kinase)
LTGPESAAPTPRYPATAAGLAAATAALEATASALGFHGETRLRLALVLEELYTNVLKYGATGVTGVWVRARLERGPDGAAELEFVDSGPAYDPFEHLPAGELDRTLGERPVGGLGVVLVEGLAVRSRYERTGDCNCVRIALRDEGS